MNSEEEIADARRATGASAEPAVARKAAPKADDLPEAFAPFVRNAWYVVSALEEVGRELRAIKVLGEPLVLYRTEAGEAVVLDDRCAHRRFPLSKSRLVGDTIQCGYHGFIYESSGRCTWAPGLKVTPQFGVRRYPCAEAGPWLWVWMGDPSRADPATIPLPPLDPDVQWFSVDGYKFNPGNYMLLIENILDLTHLRFLHGAEVASLEQVETPPKSIPTPPNSVGWIKEVDRAPGGILVSMVGGDPDQIVRMVQKNVQFGPSLNYGIEERHALPGEEAFPFPVRFLVANAITPEDLNGTHQFFFASFNSRLASSDEEFRHVTEDVIFEQDVTAIAYMHQNILEDHRTGPREYGIPSDRFGVSMRRILRQMRAEEG